MSLRRVVAWRAGNLNETAQRGNLAVEPRARRSSAVVDLDDDPVDVVLQGVALLRPFLPIAGDLAECGAAPGVGIGLESQGGQRPQGLPLAFRLLPVEEEIIEEGVQAAGGHFPGVEQAERAGRGVTGIGEERLAGFFPFAVDEAERGEGQEDLAPDFDLAAAGDGQREALDRPDVGRDFVALRCRPRGSRPGPGGRPGRGWRCPGRRSSARPYRPASGRAGASRSAGRTPRDPRRNRRCRCSAWAWRGGRSGTLRPGGLRPAGWGTRA